VLVLSLSKEIKSEGKIQYNMTHINTHTSMFYGASQEIFRRAKDLRNNLTPSEYILWIYLKENINGYKFRRQHPINIFIADFYCHKAKLVIEIDGEIHNRQEQKEHDLGRTVEIEKLGIKVIRFTNKEVQENIEKVICKIKQYLI
jgi:very-short-patch-repair endonuclease